MAYTRKLLYDKTINAFKENYSDVKTGEYLSRMLELLRNAKDLFHYLINSLFPNFIATSFTVIYLLLNTDNIGYVLISSMNVKSLNISP